MKYFALSSKDVVQKILDLEHGWLSAFVGRLFSLSKLISKTGKFRVPVLSLTKYNHKLREGKGLRMRLLGLALLGDLFRMSQ